MPTTSSSATTLPMSLRLPGLRAARQAAELTQAQLAEALKVSPSTISHMERGGRVSRDLARAIAWRLFVPVEELRRTPREARPEYVRLLPPQPIAVSVPRTPGVTAEQVQARLVATALYERHRAAFEQARDAGLLGDPWMNEKLFKLQGAAVAALQRCRDLGAPWQPPKLRAGRAGKSGKSGRQ